MNTSASPFQNQMNNSNLNSDYFNKLSYWVNQYALAHLKLRQLMERPKTVFDVDRLNANLRKLNNNNMDNTTNTCGSTVASETRNPLLVDPTPRYKPGKAMEVYIKQKDHGYIVVVGCKEFCFETKEKLIANLSTYLQDPDGVEGKFWNGTLVL
jgi:hypothetical protein